jgi:hypothetical protein
MTFCALAFAFEQSLPTNWIADFYRLSLGIETGADIGNHSIHFLTAQTKGWHTPFSGAITNDLP